MCLFQIQNEGEGELTVLCLQLKPPAVPNKKLRSVRDQVASRGLPNVNPKLAFGACSLEGQPKAPNLDSSDKQIGDDLEKQHVAECV